MLDELKEEGIVNKVGGRFKLSTLIQKRMVALNTGARPLVDVRGGDKMAIVIQEILQDKIYLDLEGNVQTRPAGDADDGEAAPTGRPASAPTSEATMADNFPAAAPPTGRRGRRPRYRPVSGFAVAALMVSAATAVAVVGVVIASRVARRPMLVRGGSLLAALVGFVLAVVARWHDPPLGGHAGRHRSGQRRLVAEPARRGRVRRVPGRDRSGRRQAGPGRGPRVHRPLARRSTPRRRSS